MLVPFMLQVVSMTAPLGRGQRPGVCAPLGFWDPIGFYAGVSAGRKRFLEEAEIKHGRIAMLAAIGFPVAESYHPLWGGTIDVPSYVAFQASPLQTFWVDVLLSVAILEVVSVYTFNNPFEGYEPWTVRDGRDPGDFKFDPLQLAPRGAQGLAVMKTKERNHGRVAMGAIAVMVLQEALTGEKLFSRLVV
jgi:hypothetical protein